MHVDMHVGWVMKCNQVQVGVCRLMEVKNAPDKSLPVGFYQFPRMVVRELTSFFSATFFILYESTILSITVTKFFLFS